MFINIHKHKNKVQENEITILNLNYTDNSSFEPSNQILLSTGIHPWDIKNSKSIKYNLNTDKLFAIGEIGLDKSINTPISLQKEVFINQIKIANKNNLPVILHCVKAVQEIIEIKKEYAQDKVWIYHGFNKNKQIAEQLIQNNFMLSFGEGLFTSKHKNVITEIPKNKIFLETDNSNYEIIDLYKEASKIMNISIENLERTIESNFKHLE